jgi:hypothetical protein
VTLRIGSTSLEWLGELSLQIPDALPGLGRDRFFTNASVSRSGRVSNEFWGLGNSSSEGFATLYTGLNPIVNATLSPAGELQFENVAVQHDVGGRPEGYVLRWSKFDNTTDAHTPVGDEVVVTETRGFAPPGVLQGSDYASVQIDTRHRNYPTWVPVQVYFRRTKGTWQTVGLDRGLDEKERHPN